MKKTLLSTIYLSLISTSAFAGGPGQAVPEMDGGSAMIALGLTVGVVALLREHRNKK